MTFLTAIKTRIERKVALMQYDSVRHEIDALHEEIDNLSVRLGQLVRLKCEIELLLAKEIKQ
jgi:hypothetical protein